MSAQTTYGFTPVHGAAGGIVDLAPYSIDTFINEESTGTLKFGVFVVDGTTKGVGIKLPTSATTTAGVIEGVTTNNRTTQYDLEGNIAVTNKDAVGVMRYGKIYTRVAANVTVAYGDPVYVIVSGSEAGYATNVAGTSNVNVQVKARFESAVNNGVAVVNLFNAQ